MSKNNQLINFGIVPLASIGSGFLLAVILTVFVAQSGTDTDHQRSLVSEKADSLAQQLNIKLSQIILQTNRISNSNQLVQIVADTDPASRSYEEANLDKLIPYSVRVRIFGLNEAEIDRDAIPPFSFTSLDLVNQAEIGEAVNPEAIKSNGRWILSMATSIRRPSSVDVHGTLFVYLDMQALIGGLTENVDGELKIFQTVGSADPTEIATIGSGGDVETPPLARSLANPNWTIQYTPSTAFLENEVGSTFAFLLPSILFLLIVLAGTFVGLTRILKLLDADLSHLGHQIASVASGKFVPSTSYNIESFQEVDLGLARLGKRQDEDKPVPKLDVKSITPNEQMEDLVDIEMLDEETFEEALGRTDLADDTSESQDEDHEDDSSDTAIPVSIFRAYDIRGIVNETLTTDVIYAIGLAIGSEADSIGQQTLVVGADGRISSPDVLDSLVAGLLASGRDVINIGTVPTPVLYFATHNSDTQSGVMVTGSHNPADYNGFKIVLDGRTLVESDIQRLYQRILDEDYTSGEGTLTEIDIREDYMDAITDDIVIAQPLKVVIDCGNGIAGELMPGLLTNLGCDVIPLYCDVDGTFPNHPPDPLVPENLEDLILTVKSQEADIGLALDGDGDRIIAVTKDGDIVWPDRLLMLFAKDVVSRNPGSDVIYDIKCTRHLNSVISGFGGRPIICRSGHSFVKEKMADTSAILGGEMSGHICFAERWFGFDDGLYAAGRLLEIVGSQTAGLDELLEEFPDSVVTPEIQIRVDDESKFEIMGALIENASFGEGTVTTVDGIRIDYADGWGLVRASNTNPALTLRFEADNQAGLERIKAIFREQLQSIHESLDFA